jgi:hypothetical protein
MQNFPSEFVHYLKEMGYNILLLLPDGRLQSRDYPTEKVTSALTADGLFPKRSCLL